MSIAPSADRAAKASALTFVIYGIPDTGSRNAPVVRALTHRLAARQYTHLPLKEISRGCDPRARRFMVGGDFADGGHRISVIGIG